MVHACNIPRRRFLQQSATALLGSAFSAGFSPSSSANDAGEKPNLIVILADDLGYADLGCYECKDIQTPNLDRLARRGIRLTNAYASAPVCTPTRCALITGCYQQREENLEWAIYPDIKSAGLSGGQPTLPSMLREAGYKTGMFGKWHLGQAKESNPVNQGFDEFFGFLGGNIDYFRHSNRLGSPDLYEKTEPVSKKGYITDLISQRSVDFVNRHKEEPFFLYVAYNAPHWPVQGPDDENIVLNDKEYIQRGDRKTYARMVESMDTGIGMILDAVEANGLDKNTLIVFCSDNGGDRLSNNEPLRGKKGTLWEGGIRVPCIFSWPGVLPEGRTSAQTAITMDITATLLGVARVRPSRHIDGINLLAYIAGIRPEVEQTFVWRDNWHDQKAVRWGKWKWLKIKDKEYLFNLEEDISEQESRINRNIDIYHWLRDIYNQWEEAMPNNQTLFGEELRKLDAGE